MPFIPSEQRSILVCLAALLLGLVGVSSAADRSALFPPGMLPRSEWKASPARPGMIPQTPRRITVHHLGGKSPVKREGIAPALKGNQEFHQRDKGWSDLAYHFLVDRWGRLWQGRDVNYRGDSATTYDLKDRALVCLIGDFEKEELTDEQWNAFVNTLAYLCKKYRVKPAEITMHKQLAPTTCPGKNVVPRITSGELERAVAARMESIGDFDSVETGPGAGRTGVVGQ